MEDILVEVCKEKHKAGQVAGSQDHNSVSFNSHAKRLSGFEDSLPSSLGENLRKSIGILACILSKEHALLGMREDFL